MAEPCEPIEIGGADGASFRFCAHGGHVLGWTPAGGQERLWCSRLSRCGPGQAIRGGVPVIWPQFSDRGEGPRHGVVRTRTWQVTQTSRQGERATASLRIGSDEQTLALVPHRFEVEVVIQAWADTLDVTLRASNTGEASWDFTAALHTYLRVTPRADEAEGFVVRGLVGCDAEDNTDGSRLVVPEGDWPGAAPFDVAVRDVSGPVVVVDENLGALELTAPEGFADRVVWNPGPDAPGDVHAGGATEFVCVEAAQLSPVTLAPGGRWAGVQRLRVR